MRRQHDGVAVWSLTDRSQHGRVLAEKRLRALDSLVDLCTGLVYGIDEEGEWYFNGSGKRPEELKKEEE